MTGVGVRRSAEQVLALAPDTASRRAGSKLSTPGPWSAAGTGRGAVWGQCRGSGGTPYRTAVDMDGDDTPGYKCSCPSRKFPCEHALGLLLLRVGEQSAVTEESVPPQWVQKWLDGRREPDTARAPRGVEGGTEAGRKRAEQRARQRTQRMTAGAAELEQRLADLLHDGLAGASAGAAADRAGQGTWEEIAARMVDAQAPGLAARARELGSVPSSGGGWPERLLSGCALLHLLDRSLLGLDRLPEPLASTVRSRVGLTVGTAELLSDESVRVRDDWLVLARHDTEEGRLTARRSWLHGRRTRRPALLLSFTSPGRPPEPALPVGSSLDADLFFYPGAPQLRAALGDRHASPGESFEPAGHTVTEALSAYGAALCDDPWLENIPTVLGSVVPIPDPDTGSISQLVDSDGESALPVAPACTASSLWRLAAVSAGAPVTVFGACGHQGFVPYTTWDSGRTVQL